VGEKLQMKTYGKGELFGVLVGMFGQKLLY